jgi:hypothetical protein
MQFIADKLTYEYSGSKLVGSVPGFSSINSFSRIFLYHRCICDHWVTTNITYRPTPEYGSINTGLYRVRLKNSRRCMWMNSRPPISCARGRQKMLSLLLKASLSWPLLPPRFSVSIGRYRSSNEYIRRCPRLFAVILFASPPPPVSCLSLEER